MTLCSLIKTSIKDACVISYKDPLTILKIDNSDKDEALKQVRINVEGFSNNNLLQLNIEKVGKRTPITNVLNINWINYRSDAILYIYHENIHRFIIIEVKTKKPSGCANQFKSMETLIVYLLKALSIDNIFDYQNVKIAKLLITSRISKLSLKNKNNIKYNEKIKANEISYSKEDKDPILIKSILECEFKSIWT